MQPRACSCRATEFTLHARSHLCITPIRADKGLSLGLRSLHSSRQAPGICFVAVAHTMGPNPHEGVAEEANQVVHGLRVEELRHVGAPDDLKVAAVATYRPHQCRFSCTNE